MKSEQIAEILSSAGVFSGEIKFRDGDYQCPTRDFVLGAFSRAWNDFKFQWGMTRYVPESNDCDDFGDDAVCFMRRLFRKTFPGTQTAIAFGTFWFTRDDGQAHCINCYIDGEKVRFFEPQNSTEVHLSENEIASCFEARI